MVFYQNIDKIFFPFIMSTIILKTLNEIHHYTNEQKKQKKTIGFVPTMGSLHQGHLSLVDTAKQHCDTVIVSIFVNPTQFTNSQDLEQYPRNELLDTKLLNQQGVSAIFLPSEQEMYSKSFFPESLKEKAEISLPLMFSKGEGATRPGHFEGVFQVLYRFFSIINPNIVFFGQKDFQQTLLVRYMTNTFFPLCKSIVCPISREENGLARSSRNARLSPNGRKEAGKIYNTLQLIQKNYKNGETKINSLRSLTKPILSAIPLLESFQLEIRNKHSFEIKKQFIEDEDIILFSGTYEGVHLIDNIELESHRYI